MEIAHYRTIETTLDLANDYTPPIRLNAGDINGRILAFHITDGGRDVDDLNGLSARLTWNRDPTDPNSAGGYTAMTATTSTDTPTGIRRVSFATPVPRALLLQGGEHTVLGIDIIDADDTIIASRNIPAIIEPARLNPAAPELVDPLQDLHDTIDEARQLIDTASINGGTITALNPNQKASGTLKGNGWKRTLLAIPRGRGISQIEATALDATDPTVATSTDTNGDLLVTLGLPRGKQGEKGDKGDPGNAGSVATEDTAGIVKPGIGMYVAVDGSMGVDRQQFAYTRSGLYAEPFYIATVIMSRSQGMYYDALVTLTPNAQYSSWALEGPVTIQILPNIYASTSMGSPRTIRKTISYINASDPSLVDWLRVTAKPVLDTNTVTLDFQTTSGVSRSFQLYPTNANVNVVVSPSFDLHLSGIGMIT